ncbi:MAG TPA: hypothetical protein VFW80_01710 [Gaiellaceae bacterium]|nr:hypothetical protein [Gaiellaceae bacterium]
MYCIALVAALVLAWTSAPAQAATGWWTFNRNTNLDSRLSWKWTYPPSPTEYTRSWRAGSGTSKDECELGNGWLPAGWYSLRGHWKDYDASKIKGRVWYVQDKVCRNGLTQRTQLFIHSEETASRGQSCTSVYDDRFCWERESDYYSDGCIKVARPSPVASFPNDLGSAHSTYHDYGGSSKHGLFDKPDKNELYVFT